MAYTVYLDAGHGGYDNGATGYGRKEKDDNLKLTLAVGDILQDLGVDVGYTRVEDVYDSPLRKAQLANEADADLFVSIHRNASTYNNRYNGVQTLIYDETGLKKEIADAINEALEEVGFKNIGTEARTDLAVLKRTEMPAMLVEVGFIDSEKDNQIFDESFDEMAGAIAYAIYNSLAENGLTEAGNTSERNIAVKSVISRSDVSNSDTAMRNQDDIPEYNRQSESSIWESSNAQPRNDIDESEIVDEVEDFIEAIPEMMERNASACVRRCVLQCAVDKDDSNPFYQVQTGLFRVYKNAAMQKRQLERQGFSAFIQLYKDFYAVRTGYYDTPVKARQAEERLRKMGYDTLIVTVK